MIPMAMFKRADLKAQGMTDEQIDFVMNESNRSLAANYVLKSEAAAAAPDVKTTQEYQQVAAERDMLRAIGGEDFAGVKPKFREQVFGMIDRSEGAPALEEQLKTIGEKYEEYFTQQKEAEPEKKPIFGAPTEGGAPTGKTGPSFADKWSFIPKN